MLRISETAARRYVDDEQLRALAREAALELAAERPGADLCEQPRTTPVSLEVLGRMIAGLAEGARLHMRNADELGADGSLELVSFLAQALAESGPEGAALRLPAAALNRAARLLETSAELVRHGAGLPTELSAGAGDLLAEAFVADAITLRSLVGEHGERAGPTPDS